MENTRPERCLKGEDLRNLPIPNLNRCVLSQMTRSNYELRACPIPWARLGHKGKKQRALQSLCLSPLQIYELFRLRAAVMWYFRLGLGENSGHQTYFLCEQGLEISKFSSSPETLTIWDNEVHFYVACTNLQKLSRTMGATVLPQLSWCWTPKVAMTRVSVQLQLGCMSSWMLLKGYDEWSLVPINFMIWHFFGEVAD